MIIVVIKQNKCISVSVYIFKLSVVIVVYLQRRNVKLHPHLPGTAQALLLHCLLPVSNTAFEQARIYKPNYYYFNNNYIILCQNSSMLSRMNKLRSKFRTIGIRGGACNKCLSKICTSRWVEKIKIINRFSLWTYFQSPILTIL